MRLVRDRHRMRLDAAAGEAWDLRIAALPPAGEQTVVSVGALCHEPDLDVALARLHEQLVPDGRLVFVEHVGRPGPVGHAMAAWGRVASRLPRGCRSGRDIPAALRRAGFFITDLERFTMPTPVPVLRSWVSGVAVPAEAVR